MRKLLVLMMSLLIPLASYSADDKDYSDRLKSLGEAAESNEKAAATRLLAPAEKAKLQAETAKLLQEAQLLISEAQLNEAKRMMLLQEIERLKQQMRITEYEFQRIVRADYEMERELSRIRGNVNLVRSLILGRASWHTWLALEELMLSVGDVDAMVEVIHATTVPALDKTQFISNIYGGGSKEFPGGNLGELYEFVRRNNFSFKKYGESHRTILKMVAIMSKAAELRVKELQNINQSIRLTIAEIK